MKLALALLVLAGCGYRASFDNCSVRCADGVCPGGYACNAEGYCQLDGTTSCAMNPGDDALPLDAFDPACVDVVCDEERAPACIAGDTLRTFAHPGTCSAGTCSYPSVDELCAGSCANARCTGRWIAMVEQNAPAGRFGHTAVWTGDAMIVWGGAGSSTGSFGDGARYDAATGVWTAISDQGAPSPRRDHSAVWTGSEMIVFGGAPITQGTPFGDGAIYRPATDSWRPLPTTGAPSPRFAHSAVWTGKEMIVWGGGTASTSSLADGAAYNPATETWRTLAAANAPSPRRDHVAVWTGTEMIVWGGSTIYAGGSVFGDAAAYDPVLDRWTPSATTNAPSPRFQHAAVWTGSELLLWGGAVSSTGTLGDGARLGLGTASWDALPTTNQPSPRRDFTAVWTGREMLLWGGSTIVDGGSVFGSGVILQVFR
ncbi:MAG TPA: hypothetical protein VFQ53_07555 [Kofleriaceae bacterium]|nr:hypothetical protein [Kofleriaceae bacterium]